MGAPWCAGYGLGLAALAAGLLGCNTPRSLAQADVRIPQGIDKPCLEASLSSEPYLIELRNTSSGGWVSYDFELADPALVVVDPERVEPGVPSFTVAQRPSNRAWTLVIVSSFLALEETEPAWREAATRRQQEILQNLVNRCLGAELSFDRPEECSADSQHFGTVGRTQTVCVMGRYLGPNAP
ncbi:MAG: hypothetical protein QNK04_23830 [Myxococcota bacterium]|nr:hypothetical protein [Myxococcota bacterium]